MFESRIGNFPKTLLLVSWAKIQYARDEQGQIMLTNQRVCLHFASLANQNA